MAKRKTTKQNAAGTAVTRKGKKATSYKTPVTTAAKPAGVAKPARKTRSQAADSKPSSSGRRARKRNIVDSSDDEDESPQDPPHQPTSGENDPVEAQDEEANEVPAPTDYGVRLAQAAETVNCVYDGQAARLGTILDVRTDPELNNRLAYKASFFVTTDLNGDTEHDFVGILDSCRIDKPTAAKPQAGATFIADFLTPRMSNMSNDEPGFETMLCMQALFTKAGTPRSSLKALKNELRDRGLIHIALIYIFPEHQGKGLLRPALTSYMNLLRRLPEWFAFDGVLVLVPGAPKGEAGAAWDEFEAAEADTALEGVYQRIGNYQVLARNATVGTDRITVMGRLMP